MTKSALQWFLFIEQRFLLQTGGEEGAAVGVPDRQQPSLQSKAIPARLLRVERKGESGISAAVSTGGMAQSRNCWKKARKKDQAVAGVFSSDGENTECIRGESFESCRPLRVSAVGAREGSV